MTRRIFPVSDWAPASQDAPYVAHAAHAAHPAHPDDVLGSSTRPQRSLTVFEPRHHHPGDAAAAAAAPVSSLPHSCSKSLMQSWRNRPRSLAVPSDDNANTAGLRNRRMSIDELRFASLRNGFRGSNASQKAAAAPQPWPLQGPSSRDALPTPALPHGSNSNPIKGIIRRASVSLHNLIGRYPPPPSAEPAEAPAASHFLPKRLRAASHAAVDPRPNTSHALNSWRRLRQAASFRHSRIYDSDVHLGFASGSHDPNANGLPHPPSGRSHARSSYDHNDPRPRQQQQQQQAYPPEPMPASREMFFYSGPDSAPLSSAPAAHGVAFLSPVYGNPVMTGVGPPYIPPHTGNAARAAAAAAFQVDTPLPQHHHHHHHHHQPQVHRQPQSEQELQSKSQRQLDDLCGNDHESGIGIAVTSSDAELDGQALDSAVYGEFVLDDSESDITRIDFVARLPIELAIQVLSQLNASNLAIAARVSRKWNRILRNQHIWRESFLHEKASTYATSAPVKPGYGLGVPVVRPTCDWRQIYRVKDELDRRWKEGKTRPVYLNGHSDSIYCLQFDENKIITGSRDRTIRIWDMHTLECRLVIGPPSVVHDSKLLIGDDGLPAHYVTNAYHTRSSCSMPAAVSFPMHHSASILCLQYDDRMLVTGSSDSTCIVYSVNSGYRPVRRLRHHTAAVLDLCFDDRHIVTCSKDISICVWDRETGAMLKQLRGHAGPVNAVQMRGNTIVSCSGDFRVKLWNLETGRAIRELTGHTKGLACSQFSEDGRFVASAGNDRLIRIWDANTGECVREMKAHENLVRSLHIDSISGRLVSGSYDRDIKVFDMESGQQLLDFPQWHQSWVLSAKSDYRRIVSTGQDPKVLVMDFGAGIDGIEMLETVHADGRNGILGGLPSDESESAYI